jgi:hypothetical protein
LARVTGTNIGVAWGVMDTHIHQGKRTSR